MTSFRDIDIIRHHVRRGSKAGFFSLFRRGGQGSPRGKRPWDLKKILAWIAIICVSGFFAATIAFIGLVAWVSKDLPDPENITERMVAETTRIYDRTGEHVLYEVHGAQKRTVVELSEISKYVVDATVAGEDKDFYKHKGFDIRGIMRAVVKNFLRGGRVQGGSTITQQFVKNSVLTKEKTYVRKLKEVILAFEIERRFSKEQILKLYLNEIPYGSVVYGIESAAQTFFGKPAKDLSLSESALLASIPKGTTYYSPYGSHTDELVARSHSIIDAMVEQGYVGRDEAEAAKADDVLSRIQPFKEAIVAPHFVFYVRELLADEFGEQEVERGGLKVITTLDIEKQEAAEQVIAEKREDIKKWNANTAALMAMDARSGDVLAMVGSADYFDDEINGKFNSIVTGRLQPGSSIKPMVYAAAFEKGYTPSTVVYDVETVFKNQPKDYVPHNYDGAEHGPVTLKEALAGSLNIPAVQTLYLVGIDRFLEFAKRFGYTTFDRRTVGLSLVLGGALVRPIEHIGAFGTFAQDGVHKPTRAILKVEDRDGKVLLDATEGEPQGKRIIDKEVSRQINDILSDNAARAYIFGENNWLTLPDRPVAAKTGTTNEFKDAWTIGYTPSLVAGVWVGDSRGGKMKAGADGSKIAAPIWNAFMRKALAGTPVELFPPAEPVTTGKPVLDGDKSAQVTVRVDTVTGKLATDHTPPEYVEERKFGVPHSILFFVDKDDPRGPQPEHPENDPQFENWERAVAEWAVEQGITAAQPPTELDDVHLPENRPSVSFLEPQEGGLVASRNFMALVSATARRGVAKVEYALDGQPIGTAVSYPFSMGLSVPNRFGKGFHTLSAKAMDDVGNSATASITINLTAEAGPLGIQWRAPWDQQTIGRYEFPFTMRFSMDDPASIERLVVTVRDEGGTTVQMVGSLDRPPLPNVAMEWTDPPTPGRYRVTIEATLKSGEQRSEWVTVYVP